MPYREFHYRWQYDLKSKPEELWPFVADTNRFNRDTGVPSLELDDKSSQRTKSGRRLLRLRAFGVPIEWEEMPFEWVRPSRFGVTRDYFKGPVAKLVVLIELEQTAAGGTKAVYQVWARPKNPLGLVAIPLQIGLLSARRFKQAFHDYDAAIQAGNSLPAQVEAREVPESEQRRIDALTSKLMDKGIDAALANRLGDMVARADDIDLGRIRPYALADCWGLDRRQVLEACFHATRVGLLDLQWDLLCPMCRGPQETGGSLKDINSQVHCHGCQIDFNVNFDRFVEVTFRPNAAIRNVNPKTYCVGSPRRTPHVIAQQLIRANHDRVVPLALEEGRYTIRILGRPTEQAVLVSPSGSATATVPAKVIGPVCEDLHLAPRCEVTLVNNTDSEQLFVIERAAWSDQAATAAEVTALQMFRDLFSTEALRPGEQISVGTLTVLFTDLRHSTQLYREIGDATAFGRVLNHFDVLKDAIAREDGALVKTIGDAVMAVFRQPAGALRAMLAAQQALAFPPEGRDPLTLKAGMHAGPCIAVTLNDRLDYFGSTVNMAARLESLSTGSDVVISREIFEDPEVKALLAEESGELDAETFDAALKGFEEERFELLRVKLRANRAVA